MRDKIVSLILTFLELYSLVEGFDLYGYPEYYDDVDTSFRITNGIKANVADLPFVVRLDIHGGLCTGSIISDEWIITAAHCFHGVKCFGTKVFPTAPWPPESYVEPIRCVSHPDFVPDAIGADLALLKVPKTSGYNPTGRIRLPDFGTTVFSGSRAIITGFGRTENGEYPKHLLQATVKVETWRQCNRRFQESESKDNPNYHHVDIPKQLFCTVGEGERPGGQCNGDSGGPVIVNGIIEGVVSFIESDGNENECKIGAPAYATGLVHYLPWIYAHIAPGSMRRLFNIDTGQRPPMSVPANCKCW